ncbi:MAG: CotH kinase family protein [Alphaproteobacteria bacterium]|nr:CotH kinase family protein [Alphaproteobacteria bacterium]
MRWLPVLGLVACTPEAPLVPLQQQLHTTGDVFEQVFVAADVPPQVDLVLSQLALQDLRDEPREWVAGVVVLEGIAYDAEIRLKGHGSFEPVDDKPSFKIALDTPFHGMRTLILNNAHSDPTHIHERLASEVFRSLDLPAARAGNTWVAVNGQSRGMYTILEDVDDRMLHRWFGDPDGTLYELFDGDFTTELLGGFELESGPDDPALLEHIAADLALGDIVGFDVASEHFDLDRFFRFWAVTAVLAQTDAWPYAVPGDDVYLYVDPQTSLVTYLPHGLDEAFFPRGRTIAQTQGVMPRRCLVSAPCRDRFYASIDEVFAALEAGGFSARMDELLARSFSWRADPRHRPPSVELPEGHIDDLRDWLAVREAQLDAER